MASATALHTGTSSTTPCCLFWESPSHKSALWGEHCHYEEGENGEIRTTMLNTVRLEMCDVLCLQGDINALVSSVIPCLARRDQGNHETALPQTVRAWREETGALLDWLWMSTEFHPWGACGGSHLQLPTLERERLKLHTFGCQTPVIRERNVIKVVWKIFVTANLSPRSMQFRQHKYALLS